VCTGLGQREAGRLPCHLTPHYGMGGPRCTWEATKQVRCFKFCTAWSVEFSAGNAVPVSLCTACFLTPCPAWEQLGCRGETVACCTIEKANVAINKLAQEERLGGWGGWLGRLMGGWASRKFAWHAPVALC